MKQKNPDLLNSILAKITEFIFNCRITLSRQNDSRQNQAKSVHVDDFSNKKKSPFPDRFDNTSVVLGNFRLDAKPVRITEGQVEVCSAIPKAHGKRKAEFADDTLHNGSVPLR